MSNAPSPFDILGKIGVVPVIAIESADHAIPLADALLEGGLNIAEITFRTSAAEEVLSILNEKRPELTVGAGTILTPSSVEAALSNGATFGLSPGFDQTVVDAAKAKNLPFAPGVMTPSDLCNVARNDIKVAKFFPATAAGGPAMLANISAPFAHLGIRFIPTGGVSVASLPEWLKLPNVIAVGGTWIARAQHMRDGNWSEITAAAKAAIKTVKQVRG